ncbi:hypothetical protein GGS26DRAFT_134124 [Hypomontagnella submonticulosa]|nr:hypothetical protein GGS26DRAFT_134124 [Hypomontagnella submonticulosa]
MARRQICELIEGDDSWTYPEDFTPGALRLVEVEPLLSRLRSRIVLYEFPGLDLQQAAQGGDESAIPDYVAISHVWKPSPAVAARTNTRPLHIRLQGNNTHEISWLGLMQAAIVARYWKCKYIWLDFICLNQTSDIDKAQQIKNMANIYAYCSYTLVMLGGVRCAQRLGDESQWHTRAWTLQEAVESFRRGRNAVRYALVEWEYNLSFEVFRRGFQRLCEGLAIIPIQELLDLQGAGMPIAKFRKVGKYGPRSYGDTILVPINTFGQNKNTIAPLLRLLHHLPRIGREFWWDSSVWCGLWTRTSSRENDLLYSSMNLFTTPITLAVDYKEDFEVTLARFLAILHEKPRVPYWLSISHRAPVYEWSGILPKRPDFERHELPKYTIGESPPVDAQGLMCDTGCCGSLDWCVEVIGASLETGHILCAKVLKLVRVVETPTFPVYTNRHWQHVRKVLVSYNPLGAEMVDAESWIFEPGGDANVEMIDTFPIFDEDTAAKNEYDIVIARPVEAKHNENERWIRSCTQGADLTPIQRTSPESKSVDLTALCWLDGRLGPYLTILGFFNTRYQNPVVYFFDRIAGGAVQRVGAGKLLLAETDRIRDDIPWLHMRVGGGNSPDPVLDRCVCQKKSTVPSSKTR